jgi:hypothetical protein
MSKSAWINECIKIILMFSVFNVVSEKLFHYVLLLWPYIFILTEVF